MQPITQSQYAHALNGAMQHGTPEQLDRPEYTASFYVEYKYSEFKEVARLETESGSEYYGLAAYRPSEAKLKAAHKVLDELLSAH